MNISVILYIKYKFISTSNILLKCVNVKVKVNVDLYSALL